MLSDVVLGDDFTHIAQNLGRRRDGRAGPWLEAIAEGVEVAVGAYAGIAVGEPGATEAFLTFEHNEAHPRALREEVISATDAGDSGTDDQDVEVLGLARFGPVEPICLGHPPLDLFHSKSVPERCCPRPRRAPACVPRFTPERIVGANGPSIKGCDCRIF